MNASASCTSNYPSCNNSLFTAAQVLECCSILGSWSREARCYADITNYSYIVSGIFGLIGAILMYATFCTKEFKGPSCTYHRAIAIFEVWHMIVMAKYGVLQALRIPMTSGLLGLWHTVFWSGWLFAGGLKTTVSIVTAFVSAERCVALWMPLKFRRINKRSVAVSCVIIAYVIGCLHWCQMFAYDIVIGNDTALYKPSRWYPEILYVDSILQSYVLPCLKLIVCAVMAVLSAAITVGLRAKSCRAAALLNDQQGSQQWRTTKHLCYLQLLLAVTILLDHAAWAAWRVSIMTGDKIDLGNMSAFGSWQTNFERQQLTKRLDLLQGLTSQLVHCWRFYLYLLLHKKFRVTFIGLFKKSNEISSTSTVQQTSLCSKRCSLIPTNH